MTHKAPRAEHRHREKTDRQDGREKPQGATHNPLLLLVATFLLTGVIGTWLTSFWSSREWTNQQAQLRAERELAEKYSVLESTVRAIAETGAAASDIATMGFWDWSLETHRKGIEERTQLWEEASRTWRIESRVLLQTIGVHFSDPDAVSTFHRIVGLRRQLGQKVRALLETYTAAENEDQRQQLAEEINELLNRLDTEAQTLGRAMRTDL